ncbi:MAG: hypothetical protein AVDCRST_MAG55-522, partial [uncultured Rubrobacteraceae bacterium]
ADHSNGKCGPAVVLLGGVKGSEIGILRGLSSDALPPLPVRLVREGKIVGRAYHPGGTAHRRPPRRRIADTEDPDRRRLSGSSHRQRDDAHGAEARLEKRRGADWLAASRARPEGRAAHEGEWPAMGRRVQHLYRGTRAGLPLDPRAARLLRPRKAHARGRNLSEERWPDVHIQGLRPDDGRARRHLGDIPCGRQDGSLPPDLHPDTHLREPPYSARRAGFL